ncbi:hypothetical protein SCOCK_420041 [Actinacidiphila cocklensis]|uniref:Uncharacterized protein n=1 Tax=Actinacidiphila cocklensis TaxID=887465 RepID=A0A9W4DV10_9ACTN|nr:hypothetical protein SCOCK_420041 [Actinacidiphila cocklensis]
MRRGDGLRYDRHRCPQGGAGALAQPAQAGHRPRPRHRPRPAGAGHHGPPGQQRQPGCARGPDAVRGRRLPDGHGYRRPHRGRRPRPGGQRHDLRRRPRRGRVRLPYGEREIPERLRRRAPPGVRQRRGRATADHPRGVQGGRPGVVPDRAGVGAVRVARRPLRTGRAQLCRLRRAHPDRTARADVHRAGAAPRLRPARPRPAGRDRGAVGTRGRALSRWPPPTSCSSRTTTSSARPPRSPWSATASRSPPPPTA